MKTDPQFLPKPQPTTVESCFAHYGQFSNRDIKIITLIEKEVVGPLEQRMLLMEVQLGCWSATFSKYVSWLANKAPAKRWPKQVVDDYNKLAAMMDNLTQKSTK